MLARMMAVFALIFPTTIALATEVETISPMTSDVFSSYVTGRTLSYSKNGQPYGVEQYLSGNRVRWAAENGDCQDGKWFAQNDQICFLYEGQLTAQCWSFYAGDAGIIAQYENNPEQDYLYESSRTSEPLICKGPDVGV